jgi:hypothetical protein
MCFLTKTTLFLSYLYSGHLLKMRYTQFRKINLGCYSKMLIQCSNLNFQKINSKIKRAFSGGELFA